MKHSKTESYLKGKVLPIKDMPISPIKEILIRGKDRLVLFENTERIVLSRRKLKSAFNAALSAEQYQVALQSIKSLPDGKATVQIGGMIQGEQRVYSSETRAAKAAQKYYGIKTTI